MFILRLEDLIILDTLNKN